MISWWSSRSRPLETSWNLAFYLEDLFSRRVDLLTSEGISHRIRPYVERGVVWAD